MSAQGPLGILIIIHTRWSRSLGAHRVRPAVGIPLCSRDDSMRAEIGWTDMDDLPIHRAFLRPIGARKL